MEEINNKLNQILDICRDHLDSNVAYSVVTRLVHELKVDIPEYGSKKCEELLDAINGNF